MNPRISIIPGLLLLSCITTFAADPPSSEKLKADSNRIQGTWKVVALETQGIQAPPEVVAAMSLVFKATKLTFVPGEPGFTHYTFTLDPAAKPARFDMTPADGKGQTQKAIYLLEGDTLKLCVGMTDRPKAFSAHAQSKNAVYTLKRAKP